MQRFIGTENQKSAEMPTEKGGERVAKNNEEKIYENMKSLEEWAIAGISQKEMADMLDMAYSTFRELKKKIPALSALLKKCAEIRKAEKQKELEGVERSLLDRCMGYNAKVMKPQKLKKPVRDACGEIMVVNGKAVMEEVTEFVIDEQHVPADVGAIKFYLLNKGRKDWKNDPEKLAIEKKRLENDTKRTKLAESNAGVGKEEKSIEDILSEAAAAAEGDADE